MALGIRKGRLTSVELTEFYLERLKSVNEQLLCVVTMNATAMETARLLDAEVKAGKGMGILQEIPLAARIVSIADVYDALSVKRVYKDAYAHEIFVEKIRSEAGRQFDPGLVEVFLSIEKHFREIAQSFDHSPQLTGVFQAAVDAGLMSREDVSPPVGTYSQRDLDAAAATLASAAPVTPSEKPPSPAPPEQITAAV